MVTASNCPLKLFKEAGQLSSSLTSLSQLSRGSDTAEQGAGGIWGRGSDQEKAGTRWDGGWGTGSTEEGACLVLRPQAEARNPQPWEFSQQRTARGGSHLSNCPVLGGTCMGAAPLPGWPGSGLET